MALFEEVSLYTKKRRKQYPKKYLGYKRYDYFEIRPLFDLKDKLKFEFGNILYEDDVCYVVAKRRKDIIYKYVVIYNLDKYKSLRLTNELLVSYNLGKKFENGFRIEDLGVLPMVEVIILDEMNEANIRYAIINTTSDKKLFKMGLVYDSEYALLIQFLMNKEYGGMSKEFKQAIYHDIGAKDVEDI